MLAIDTNVVVRYLTHDHPIQSKQAKALIHGHHVYVSMTVVLESDWVLRSAYGYSSAQLCEALRSLAGLDTVTVEDPGCLARALQHAEAGMDFADALHIERTDRCDAFFTFDRQLVTGARRRGLDRVKDLSARGGPA